MKLMIDVYGWLNTDFEINDNLRQVVSYFPVNVVVVYCINKLLKYNVFR